MEAQTPRGMLGKGLWTNAVVAVQAVVQEVECRLLHGRLRPVAPRDLLMKAKTSAVNLPVPHHTYPGALDGGRDGFVARRNALVIPREDHEHDSRSPTALVVE